MRCGLALVVAMPVLLAACATSSPPATVPAATYDAQALVAAVRAAGAVDGGELDVQPLRDPQVEDLREQAMQMEQKHMYRGAADLLDRAIGLNAEDPALLQDRAELALLLREPEAAVRFAQQAIGLGSAAGPLCRRHWETVAQAALLRADDRLIRRGETFEAASRRVNDAATEARDARARRDACTVAALQRY